jgi:aldehyde dehydrogenase (NAD+)
MSANESSEQGRHQALKPYHMQALVNGKWMNKTEKLEIHDPYSGEIVGTVPKLSPEDTHRAIESASKYSSSLSAWDRYLILAGTAREILERTDEFASLISREAGIALKSSRLEVERAYQVLLLSAEEAKRITSEVIPADISPGIHNWVAITLREPVGVISAITPFNHPLNQVVHKIGPAIAANNRLILKPSEKTPLTALLLGEVLLHNGLPSQMLNIVTGDATMIGDLLVTHPEIRMISFTGSVQVGNIIAKKAGVKRLCLELGGNGAAIVMDDADIERATSAVIKGSFSNSGQRCTAIKRVLLHSAIADRFVDLLLSKVKALKYGDPLDPNNDIGTLIDENAAIRIEQTIQGAIQTGAKLLYGGKRFGALIPPTVLDYVKPEAEIVVHETFGPIAPIIRFESKQEALSIANSTIYGLQAGIFTRDLDTAMYFARNLEVGGVVVNEAPGFRVEYLPFGGVKMSGVGREGVRYAIQSMTEIKTIMLEMGVSG